MDSRPLYTFPKWANKLALGSLLLLATGPIYAGLLLWYGANPVTLNVGYAPVQPVPYSHALHVGKLGMDCRYCHNTVEKTGMAALPATETCMNCHTNILPKSDKLAPVRESYKSGMPVPWVKVHDLPEYAYFNHSAHVNAGVGCIECHGRIDQMERVETVKPLNMGWCLECHRDPRPFVPEGPSDEHAVDAAGRPRGLRPAAQGQVSRQPEHRLRDMPSMTPETPNNTSPTRQRAEESLASLALQACEPAPRYWRSLEQLADTPEFRAGLERQPALGAAEALHASRRKFLQTMGASLGLAGLTATGCIRLPEEKLAPYAHRPENRTPGTPVSYATAFELGGVAQGLLVTSYDGRPIKIEGNPSHPLNAGAADIAAQASVLELYDPDRSYGVIKRKQESQAGKPDVQTWDDFRKEFLKQIPADGTGFCVLSEASSSPSFVAMRDALLKKFPKAEWFEYEPVSDANVRAGSAIAFNSSTPRMASGSMQEAMQGALVDDAVPVVDLTQAKVIVSLDADLFGDGSPLAIKYARDFAAGRRLHDKEKQKEMNRLYVIESLHTITGACADHRAACRASEIEDIARELAAALGVAGIKAPKGLKSPLLDRIKTDLEENTGHSVVVAGPRQPAAVHALVAAINIELHNVNKTVVYYPRQHSRPMRVVREASPSEAQIMMQGRLYGTELAILVAKMKSGALDAPAHPRRQSRFQRPGRSRFRRGAEEGQNKHSLVAS